jgi:predicted nucleic acid-binding protein
LTVYVLDASVAAKWFLSPKDEPLTAEALALFEKYVREEVRFIVPDLFWAELASAFRKAIRLGRFSRASAEEAITYLLRCDLPAYPTAPLLERAFHIAMTYDRSVYDSVYVAVALRSHSQLITADERLANALAARFPVKWLGAVS